MNIPEAIEILNDFDNGKYPGGAETFRKAVKLGSEALKREQARREGYESIVGTPLPSETKD